MKRYEHYILWIEGKPSKRNVNNPYSGKYEYDRTKIVHIIDLTYRSYHWKGSIRYKELKK